MNTSSTKPFFIAFGVSCVVTLCILFSLSEKTPEQSGQKNGNASSVPPEPPNDFIVSENIPPDILFIPGLKSKGVPPEEYSESLHKVFPDSKIDVKKWESNWELLDWPVAVDRAEKTVTFFVEEIERLPDEKRQNLVLIGHSLGGRIAVRTLARLADSNIRIKRGIFLGSAIPDDDPDFEKALTATLMPCINIYNREDYVLRSIYGLTTENTGEKEFQPSALGAFGSFRKYPMAMLLEFGVTPAPNEKQKGQKEKLENHMAIFYIEEIGLQITEKCMHNYLYPPTHIRRWSLTKGDWQEIDNVQNWRLQKNTVSGQSRILSPWDHVLLVDDDEQAKGYFASISMDLRKNTRLNQPIVTPNKDEPIKVPPLPGTSWKTIEEYDGWQLQHGLIRYRIVDNRDYQRLLGFQETNIQQQFAQIKEQLQQRKALDCQ